MLISGFALRCNEYLAGSEYGQSGSIPTTEELPAQLQEGIWRAVAYGRLAAVAMNEGNATLATDIYRNRFQAHYRAVLRHLGLTWGQWEMCYAIGYNAARNEAGLHADALAAGE